jgi:hypothetical protein
MAAAMKIKAAIDNLQDAAADEAVDAVLRKTTKKVMATSRKHPKNNGTPRSTF